MTGHDLFIKTHKTLNQTPITIHSSVIAAGGVHETSIKPLLFLSSTFSHVAVPSFISYKCHPSYETR